MSRLLIYTHTQSSIVLSTQECWSEVSDSAGKMEVCDFLTVWQTQSQSWIRAPSSALCYTSCKPIPYGPFSRELNCIKRKGKMLGNSYLNAELEPRHLQLQLICSDDGRVFSVLFFLSNVLVLPWMLLKATCSGTVVFSLLNNARQTITNALHICLTTTAYWRSWNLRRYKAE